MDSVNIVNANILDWSADYKGAKFHALLTDSPYEYGFLDKSWDSTGISFDKATWEALATHLYPGAFGMTYGGSRTWHRIAAAIEDAGLIVHPSIFCWVYATGLHKAKRLDYLIDKEDGVYDQREVIGKSTASYGYQKSGKRWAKDHYITKPASEASMVWWEHRYGIQALRPAVEPVILFQKPYEGRIIDSARKYGTGTLHTESAKYNEGKWPTNFFVVHHPMCTSDYCYHSCNVASLDSRSDFFPSMEWEYDKLEPLDVWYSKKSSGPEKYVGIDPGVAHPTMKPLSANKWLGGMLLPPEVYAPRRLLVPFGGVMSETIGAMLAGWDSITSVEITPEYAKAGASRVSWWADMIEEHGPNVDNIIKSLKSGAKQLPLDF